MTTEIGQQIVTLKARHDRLDAQYQRLFKQASEASHTGADDRALWILCDRTEHLMNETERRIDDLICEQRETE